MLEGITQKEFESLSLGDIVERGLPYVFVSQEFRGPYKQVLDVIKKVCNKHDLYVFTVQDQTQGDINDNINDGIRNCLFGFAEVSPSLKEAAKALRISADDVTLDDMAALPYVAPPNPNALMELGIFRGAKRPVVLLTTHYKECVTDRLTNERNTPFVTYDRTDVHSAEFEAKLEKAIVQAKFYSQHNANKQTDEASEDKYQELIYNLLSFSHVRDSLTVEQIEQLQRGENIGVIVSALEQVQSEATGVNQQIRVLAEYCSEILGRKKTPEQIIADTENGVLPSLKEPERQMTFREWFETQGEFGDYKPVLRDVMQLRQGGMHFDVVTLDDFGPETYAAVSTASAIYLRTRDSEPFKLKASNVDIASADIDKIQLSADGEHLMVQEPARITLYKIDWAGHSAAVEQRYTMPSHDAVLMHPRLAITDDKGCKFLYDGKVKSKLPGEFVGTLLKGAKKLTSIFSKSENMRWELLQAPFQRGAVIPAFRSLHDVTCLGTHFYNGRSDDAELGLHVGHAGIINLSPTGRFIGYVSEKSEIEAATKYNILSLEPGVKPRMVNSNGELLALAENGKVGIGIHKGLFARSWGSVLDVRDLYTGKSCEDLRGIPYEEGHTYFFNPTGTKLVQASPQGVKVIEFERR